MSIGRPRHFFVLGALTLKRIPFSGVDPAGALVAAELARSGREVLLFDEKLAWEKPCGGGLTDKALARWPFLRAAQVDPKWIRDCELIAPSGRKAAFQLDQPIAIFSRLALNGLVLDRAREAGARVFRERITKIDRNAGVWLVQASSVTHHAV